MVALNLVAQSWILARDIVRYSTGAFHLSRVSSLIQNKYVAFLVAPWQKGTYIPYLGCENNNKCLCYLSLSYESGDAAITIGDDNEIETTVLVANSGKEPAYNAKLLIQLDQMITPPRQCTTTLDGSESQVIY